MAVLVCEVSVGKSTDDVSYGLDVTDAYLPRTGDLISALFIDVFAVFPFIRWICVEGSKQCRVVSFP